MSFVPTRVAIVGVTNATPAVVTTESAHNLSTGNVVRLHVPVAYGMTPLDNNLYIITVLSNITFSLQYSQVPSKVDVDSSTYPAFIAATNQGKTAEVLPVGAGPTPTRQVPPLDIHGAAESLIDDQMANITTVEIPL